MAASPGSLKVGPTTALIVISISARRRRDCFRSKKLTERQGVLHCRVVAVSVLDAVLKFRHIAAAFDAHCMG